MVLFAKQKQRHRSRRKTFGYEEKKLGDGWDELGGWD